MLGALVRCLAGFLAVMAFGQTPGALQTYTDPKGRFSFTYPGTFGTISPGTNDGFGDRVAAIRFSNFSAGVRSGVLVQGGEAVMTRGFPLVDLQAAGGLYDSIALEVFPAAMRAVVLKNLPALTAANLCEALAGEQHADPAGPGFTALPPTGRQAIGKVDHMRHVEPKLRRCEVSVDTVTFDEDVALEEASNRQHVYGAIRFLPPPYSTFQLIRGTREAPAPAVLAQIRGVVKSWVARK
jgi:hypothetical protein